MVTRLTPRRVANYKVGNLCIVSWLFFRHKPIATNPKQAKGIHYSSTVVKSRCPLMLQQSNLDVLLHAPPPLVCPADVRFLSLRCSNKDVLCTCCVAIELDPIKLNWFQTIGRNCDWRPPYIEVIFRLYLCYWLRNASVRDKISWFPGV